MMIAFANNSFVTTEVVLLENLVLFSDLPDKNSFVVSASVDITVILRSAFLGLVYRDAVFPGFIDVQGQNANGLLQVL